MIYKCVRIQSRLVYKYLAYLTSFGRKVLVSDGKFRSLVENPGLFLPENPALVGKFQAVLPDNNPERFRRRKVVVRRGTLSLARNSRQPFFQCTKGLSPTLRVLVRLVLGYYARLYVSRAQVLYTTVQ
jgi:hypothetical protein